MTTDSTRTTGGDPVEGVDPGGTRPTSAGRNKSEQKIAQKVTSGDRNTGVHSGVAPNTDPVEQK